MFDKMIEVIGDTPFVQDDLRVAGYLLFKKLAASVIYHPNKKIKGPVILIKATENFLHLEKDYGLSNVRDFSFLFLVLLNFFHILNIIFIFCSVIVL